MKYSKKLAKRRVIAEEEEEEARRRLRLRGRETVENTIFCFHY
jgi:hypothetical protein